MLRLQDGVVPAEYYNPLEIQALPSVHPEFHLTCPAVHDIIQVRLFKSYFAGGRFIRSCSSCRKKLITG
jgi:hypothetical protein